MSTAPHPGVLVYRSFVLAYSETFIATQAEALRHYRPTIVGQTRVSGADLRGLPVLVAADYGSEARSKLSQRGAPFSEGFLQDIRATNPALLHAHFGPDAVAGERLARILDIPFVVTFHGYDAARSTALSQGLSTWRYGRRIPGLSRRAGRVIAVSDHIRQRLIDRGCPGENIVTHFIGVDTERFRPAEANAVTEGPLVLAVGRFVEKKGFADLIEAFKMVRETFPAAKMTILGDGELRPALAAAAGTGSGIDLPGAVSAGEVASWLQRADVLVVPSVTAADGDTEGLPTILAEAMASGIPVVGTRHAGIPEAIADEETGLLVPERHPADLAAAIRRLLADPATRSRMGASARTRAETQFSISRQSAALEAIYDGVLHNSTNHRQIA